MKIRILQSAFNDLDDGAEFYEKQELGVGGYFIDSLLSDIDSLALYAGERAERPALFRHGSPGHAIAFAPGFE